MTVRSLGALTRESRGAVFVETLIAFLVVLGFGMSTWQMIELWTGHLLIKRAASAAARAAVVVLPDDPRFYNDEGVNQLGATRMSDIELAAAMVLAISPHFPAKPRVEITPTSPKGYALLTATVTAPFYCTGGWAGWVCGGSYRTLTAKATFPYQGADYAYR